MAKPTWDDTEEIEDIPKFEDTMDVEEMQMQEEPSMLESAGRGAVQGATFGLGEEIGSAVLTPLEALRAKISSLIPGSSENVDAQLREQGFTGDIQEKGLIDTYKELRDTTREANKAAEEANPATYMTSDIAGGIIPAIATGGGAAAAKVGSTLGKEGLKEAAKLGAKYGAVSGLGYGESDLTEGDVLGAATDTAIGGTIGAAAGAALPVAGKAIKKGASKLGSGVQNIIEAITPESGAIKAGFKYGQEGKKLTQEVVDTDMKKLASGILGKIKSAKNEIDLDGVKQQLDDLGIKVDTKEAFETAIDDIQKIVNNDVLDISNKQLLPKLQKMAGIDTEALKMANKAEKKAIQKALEAQSKQEQAIIKGEKKLAQQAIKSGDDLDVIRDIQRQMDDLDLPLTTPEGQIGGVQGRFKGPDGEEYVKSVLDDVTPYQPKISSNVGPDGRPIIQTKDLGSGKITAMVGDINTKVEKDLANMSVSEVENVRKQLNVLTKMAKSQGSEGDPVIVRAKQLAVKLRDLTDKAVKEGSPEELAASRKKMSDILSAEDLLGTSRTNAVEAGAKKNEQVRTLAEKLGFNKGFKTRDEANEAIEKLGEDIISPADAQRFDMFKELNSIMGRESQENISRAGLYKKAVGDLPNLAGRTVKKASDIVSPVIDAKKAVTQLTDDQLSSFGNKLATSENKGLQDIGARLLEAANMESTAKQNLLWSLSQSPAMRKLIQDQATSLEENEEVMFGNTESSELPEISAPLQGDSQAVSDSVSTSQNAIMRDDTISPEQPEVSENKREPSSIKNIDEGLEKILELEAGYQAQETDEGNFIDGKLIGTNRGITPVAYKEYFGKEPSVEDMKSLSKEDALNIYKANYINKPNFDQLTDPNLQLAVVDFGVNSGPNRATRYLQKLVGAKQDGILGPDTLKKIEEYEGNIVQDYINERRDYIKALDNPTYEKGWLNRIKEIEDITTDKPDLSALLNNYAQQEEPSQNMMDILQPYAEQPIETPSEDEISDISNSIDLVNKMQGSGDDTPADDLEALIGKIDRLRVSQESKDDLVEDAINMTSYSQGQALKEKLQSLG